MNRYYDNWERLVDAVIRRERLLNLCRQSSRSTSVRSDTSTSSSAAFDSSSRSDHFTHPFDDFSSRFDSNSSFDLSAKKKHKPAAAIAMRTLWRGLSNLRISKLVMIKKEPRLESRSLRKAHEQVNDHRGVDQELSSSSRSNAELQRLRDLYTLKAHIEAMVKIKGLDINTIRMSYSV